MFETFKGKYIAIMDADDISDKNRFEAEVDFLDKNSSFGLVGTNAIWIDKDNKPFGEGFNFAYSPEELKCRLLFHNCFVHTSVLIRKSILDANHLNYKELAGEDFVAFYDMDAEMTRVFKGGANESFVYNFDASQIESEDGKSQTWTIVGEDEADAAKGRISHVSPMAIALFGKAAGEVATVNGKEWEIVALKA